MDEPKFNANGMWRGDMWPTMTYLVAYGLNRYGYVDVAIELTHRMLRLIGEHGINERYNPQTGQPLGVQGLGMSCSVWLMIVQNIYGIQEDFRTIRVPPNAQGRRLHLGKLMVAYLGDGVVQLRSTFGREFHVVFPEVIREQEVIVTCDGEPLGSDEFASEGCSVVFTAEPDREYRVLYTSSAQPK